MGLGFEDVADIIRIIDGSACDEFILETSEFKLVLRRRGASGRHEPVQSLPPALAPAIASPQTVKRSSQQSVAALLGDRTSAGREIRSPMVGTFFRAPSPGAPNFVQAGSTGAPNFVQAGSIIKKDDPLCIIEVMKLFTTIQAECNGRIVFIGAENNELVEFGRLLFVIEEIELKSQC
jgi:biotin carboxyl carrier protein